MYRIVLSCTGIPEKEGASGASDVIEEFGRRPWHQRVTCVWKNQKLIFTAENDFDADGRALAAEFSDAVCACLPASLAVQVQIESVLKFDEKQKA
jgi:hypothetical protein